MPFSFARRSSLLSRPVRAGYRCGLAALLVFIGCESLQNATAEGDTRTISFHHIHTNEDLTITYKVNGRYDEDALNQINKELRDWREEKPIKIDPHLIDLLWEVHRELEATSPIYIICGYRSPGTNAMLRRRSSGVAKFSQHMLGKAIDFHIPGVPLDKLREAGLRAQRGGVGFYPSSNFVHLDTGSVRHWPRMPEAQLARVMAKGKLTTVAASDRAGTTKVAAAKFTNPIAKLFGAKDEDETAAPAAVPTPAPSPVRTAEKPKIEAKTEPKIEAKAEKPVVMAAAVPVPPARPAAARQETQPATFEVASATSRPVQLRPAQGNSLVARASTTVVVASNSANDIISERGFWQGMPEVDMPVSSTAAKSATPPRPPAGIPVASNEPIATGTIGGEAPWAMPEREPAGPVLAYAPVTPAVAPSRPAPMGTAATRNAPVAQPDTTVAVKRTATRPAASTAPAATVAAAVPVKPGQRFNDPWMRAMIVAPSAQGFMSTSLLGAPDYRVLAPHLRKPPVSVMMTFSDDPYLGMTDAKFSGSAVVFVATVTFSQRTAALR
ncbi:MAG: hypothetical protein QOG83_2359 [Alphaproteobacteria bacterium]|nr:hypothetical protein [Alphaproteobacteria bacterium]